MRRFCVRILYVVLALVCLTDLSAQLEDKPNILFIAVDDMNCDFGAYGNREVHSPNLDDLANSGVLFTNNHCQQAVCGASRASVLSGFTPMHTGVTSFYIYLRDLYPDIVTIPQFFKNEGYTTVGMGKIHDPRNVSETDNVDMVGWSDFKTITGSRWLVSSGSPVTEMADLPDNSYVDGKLAVEGVNQIKNLAGNSEPFFLAVGFKKPHLPFVAPKKYWDMYNRDSISLAPFRKWAENDTEFVHNPGGEFFNSYDNVPEMGTWSDELQREYIHGYYACVSFIDAQVGKLINELKVQGVYENTIIILWGDHGFSLGDHGNWGKHTNFEYSTRSPLIIKAPGMRSGIKCKSPSELLDIYPTLVDLAGFPVPDTLDGSSLVPILDGSKEKVKSFSVSRYKRGGNLGYALRTEYYQYVEWTKTSSIEHQQLFNFAADPYQTMNLYSIPDYHEIRDTFSFNLNSYLDDGINTRPIYLTADTDSLGLNKNFKHLSFSVLGKTGPELVTLDEAEIEIDKYLLPTSAAGYAGLNLYPGEYAYRISKEGYWPSSAVFDLSRDTIIVDTLIRRYVNATITLLDSVTENPVNNFTFTLDGESLTTGLNGSVDQQIEPGIYGLVIDSEEYRNIDRNIEIVSDTNLVILLRPKLALIKFNLKNDGAPVNNAFINLNGEEKISNAIGIVNFYDQKVDSSYDYLVTKEGFNDIEGSFILLNDTTLQLEMILKSYTAEFTILDSSSLEPVDMAEVSFNDQLKSTDNAGLVAFFDLLPANYDIEISKDGYKEYTSALEVASDTSIAVKMKRITSAENIENVDLYVYPNPAKDHIYIRNAENIAKLQISDLSGKSVMKINELNRGKLIELPGLQTGLYIVELISLEQKRYSLKLYIHQD